ncbi:MAG: glutamate-5-semialdehyde dehydrogenase [Bacteroidales bacterium]|nr:glutamate-5-semialdehyde dehydrogenase [Bacteroidales bacterium]
MIENQLSAAREASYALLSLNEAQTNALLLDLADALESQSQSIVAANAADLSRMDASAPNYDRLLLNAERIQGIAADTRNVASLPSPLNRVLSEVVRPNGMKITKVSVPFGVIGVIYEARPNVTVDVFSLCFKAGSAALLKGGKEAADSNAALVQVIHQVLAKHGLPEALCTLLPNDREATAQLLNAVGQVDLVIPRGSRGLIDFVRQNARVPVIETGAGVCHTYIDKSADLEKARAIICNGKTRRVSVCNALDCVVLHEALLPQLDYLLAPSIEKGAQVHVEEPEWFGREMLSLHMAVKVVRSADEAIAFVQRHTSHHSESIVAEDQELCQRYARVIDAACVYQNLPTSWTDGAQFGFGAEIGISTQKLHARGPMALPEITTYKYIIVGEGQTRG